MEQENNLENLMEAVESEVSVVDEVSTGSEIIKRSRSVCTNSACGKVGYYIESHTTVSLFTLFIVFTLFTRKVEVIGLPFLVAYVQLVKRM